jgi:hypothetical protein
MACFIRLLGVSLTIPRSEIAVLVSGLWQHRNRHQSDRHDSLHAMSGHDARSHAAAGVALSDDGWAARADTAVRRQIMLLIDRYLGGHFDTQAGGSATSDALLLDFRTPGGSS